MKAYRNWLRLALAVLAGALLCVGAANYLGDPYGLFRRDFSNQFLLPNQHFIKVRHVVNHPDRYDCFVLGSSRVNGIDVRKIRDGRCYNMTLAGGIPREHLNNLRYMLTQGVTVRTVLLGLDEFSYSVRPDIYLSQPLRYPYPPVIHEKVLPYYLKYLFSIFSGEVWKRVWNGYASKRDGRNRDDAVYDMYETGITFSPQTEEAIERDPGKHALSPVFSDRGMARDEVVNMDGVLEDVRAIVELAGTHKIRLVVFINPAFWRRYLYTDREAFLSFKKKLSAITEYYDFSGLNEITKNPYYYYGLTHYRLKLGDLLVARIFGDDKVVVPEGFGPLVTKSNIEAHIAMLRRQFQGY